MQLLSKRYVAWKSWKNLNSLLLHRELTFLMAKAREISLFLQKKGVHSLMDYFYSTFRNLSTPEQRNLRSSDGGKANKVSTSPKDFLEEVIMNRSKCSRDCFTVCHIANFVKKFVKTMICVWLVPWF